MSLPCYQSHCVLVPRWLASMENEFLALLLPVRRCTTLCSSCAFLQPRGISSEVWLLQGILWLRSSEAVHLSHETEDLLHLLVPTVWLPRPTARRAATIEPTMQEPISKARALKNRPPSNSTLLFSICISPFSSGVCAKPRIGAQILPWSLPLEEHPDSERSSLPPRRTRNCKIDVQTALQPLHTAWVLVKH